MSTTLFDTTRHAESQRCLCFRCPQNGALPRPRMQRRRISSAPRVSYLVKRVGSRRPGLTLLGPPNNALTDSTTRPPALVALSSALGSISGPNLLRTRSSTERTGPDIKLARSQIVHPPIWRTQ
ncbi:hypothetical protein FKP32DRAFT_1166726 [Trametes sanguinea]|nr:hypothetical protein FKP32DRAFT_1166726 [Trametes sanguinea]